MSICHPLTRIPLLLQIVMAQVERRNFLLYFSKAWNVLDFLSNSLLVACMVIWWIFVKK